MKFTGFYNRSVWLTVFSIVLTVSAVTMNFPLKYMILSLIIAGICDLFDGVIARRCKRTEQEKEFGIQLDTLADIINFGVFPAVIYSKVSGYSLLTAVVCSIYVFCAVERLAFFNVITHESKGFFRGLPSTYAALIISAVYVVLQLITGVTGGNCNSIVYTAVYLIIAFLFVLDFRMKKPGGKMYIVFVLAAVALTAGVILL